LSTKIYKINFKAPIGSRFFSATTCRGGGDRKAIPDVSDQLLVFVGNINNNECKPVKCVIGSEVNHMGSIGEQYMPDVRESFLSG
jgi:hypothetical protein